jgi:hypothetical protein
LPGSHCHALQSSRSSWRNLLCETPRWDYNGSEAPAPGKRRIAPTNHRITRPSGQTSSKDQPAIELGHQRSPPSPPISDQQNRACREHDTRAVPWFGINAPADYRVAPCAQLERRKILSGAPYGYSYIKKSDGTPASYHVILHEAKVVREIFEGLVHEQKSIASSVGDLLLPQPAAQRPLASRTQQSWGQDSADSDGCSQTPLPQLAAQRPASSRTQQS